MTDEQKKKFKAVKGLLECDNSDELKINQWEQSFIETLKEDYDLSAKQDKVLDKIYDKI